MKPPEELQKQPQKDSSPGGFRGAKNPSSSRLLLIQIFPPGRKGSNGSMPRRAATCCAMAPMPCRCMPRLSARVFLIMFFFFSPRSQCYRHHFQTSPSQVGC